MKKYLFSWHLGALFQKQVRNINFVYQQISVNDVKASENTIGRKREVGRIYEDWRYCLATNYRRVSIIATNKENNDISVMGTDQVMREAHSVESRSAKNIEVPVIENVIILGFLQVNISSKQ